MEGVVFDNTTSVVQIQTKDATSVVYITGQSNQITFTLNKITISMYHHEPTQVLFMDLAFLQRDGNNIGANCAWTKIIKNKKAETVKKGRAEAQTDQFR